MPDLSRRGALGAATGAALVAGIAKSSGAMAQGVTQGAPLPVRGNEGADILGPRNLAREAQNPDIVSPPATDAGTLPNLRFSFADAHQRIEPGGWARQVTARELPVSKSIAGVNMRLKSNVVRELHWHKEAEWSYMLAGRARITAVDQDGNFFIDDVGPGDLWYFPSGIPHSIQGIGDEGCEFLLVFDSGDFSEDSTFLLTDWFAHTPKDVLAKNFALPASAFDNIPKKELYIFPAPAPGATVAADTPAGAGKVPESFSYRMLAQDPFRFPGGTVRITDSKVFKASRTIAAALVEIEPGGIRELHWHPNTDEWQYYIEGTGRMTVFASQSSARTFDFAAGDVGYVPFAQGHYVENTGSTTLRFLEMFRSDHYADISARQWLALTPHALVQAHLNLPASAVEGFPAAKTVVIKG